MNWWHLSGALMRRYNHKFLKPGIDVDLYLRGTTLRNYSLLGGHGRRIGIWFREHGVQVARACARQFECIAAQRVRRSVQIFYLYTRIWDEVALKEFVKSWRCRVGHNAREFLIGAIGVSMYNWDRERITDKEMDSYSKEIEGIYKLRESTITCSKCHLRLVIDITQPGVKYCRCHGVKPALASAQNGEEWQPFIERQDMIVWRREEPSTGGLYAYKVYGSFADVSAEDFLQVQVDVDYRKEWDPTARQLKIVDTDPKSKHTPDHCSDVVYWEMIWPRLFANRDYVYQRRWAIDKDRGVIVIVSKGTNHPKCPNRTDAHRVTTYWSYMVIRPYKEFDKPGIEFGLTYFDDPGVNIPSAVTTWVAMSGLPDFLCRMRTASRDYQKRKGIGVDSKQSSGVGEEKSILQEAQSDSTMTETQNVSDVDREEGSPEKTQPTDESQKGGEPKEVTGEVVEEEEGDLEDKKESILGPTPDEDRGFMHYFLPSRLFA